MLLPAKLSQIGGYVSFLNAPMLLLKWLFICVTAAFALSCDSPHVIAGKGVLNIFDGVLPKWYLPLPFLSYDSVTRALGLNWPVFAIYICCI